MILSAELLPRVSRFWYASMDGDERARALFDRHYSRRHYRDGRRPKLFAGPGEKLVLVTANYDALFVWRKFIDDAIPKQNGVNCAVFRNESDLLSSYLIRNAEEIAHKRWPGERLYTYVNGDKIKSSNPGFCFIMADWRPCGYTKGGLRILEAGR